MPPAARAALNAEQGLEGAEQGLRGWLGAQVSRRHTEATANRACSGADAEAEAVARQVLVSYLDTVPTGLATRLAEWIEQRIAAARGGEGRVQWQRELAKEDREGFVDPQSVALRRIRVRPTSTPTLNGARSRSKLQ